MLQGKKIVLAVTGSIAAYKTPILVRLLVKAGADVRVLMTSAAGGFVTALTLATVSKNEVFADVHNGAQWNNHVALGLWADAMVIAPCSANTLAKLANGLCDNLVTAVYLSARCPVFIAPAMDEDMWLHPATQHNITRLGSYSNHILPVGIGELASGLNGPGRMAEPEEITRHLDAFFTQNLPLAGKKALVTAGPTYERIDPVRFIGNFSTGKMGIAIAESLASQGAEVTLVCGPTHLNANASNIKTVAVESALELYNACINHFPICDIAVLAAAVADYRPVQTATEKIKKAGDELLLQLTKTEDTLAALGKIKRPNQTLVGFALETNNELDNARKKLEAKNADLIVLNSLKDEGAGFGHDTNKITLVSREANRSMPLMSKHAAADAITAAITELLYAEETL